MWWPDQVSPEGSRTFRAGVVSSLPGVRRFPPGSTNPTGLAGFPVPQLSGHNPGLGSAGQRSQLGHSQPQAPDAGLQGGLTHMWPPVSSWAISAASVSLVYQCCPCLSQYFSWPDHAVPTGPAGVLGFLEEVNRAQRSAPGAGRPTVVPAVATGGRGGGAGPRGAAETGGGAGPRGHWRCNPVQGPHFVLRIATGILVEPHSARIGCGGTVVVTHILVGVIRRQGEPPLRHSSAPRLRPTPLIGSASPA